MPWFQHKQTKIRVEIDRFMGRWAKYIGPEGRKSPRIITDEQFSEYEPVDWAGQHLIREVLEAHVRGACAGCD